MLAVRKKLSRVLVACTCIFFCWNWISCFKLICNIPTHKVVSCFCVFYVKNDEKLGNSRQSLLFCVQAFTSDAVLRPWPFVMNNGIVPFDYWLTRTRRFSLATFPPKGKTFRRPIFARSGTSPPAYMTVVENAVSPSLSVCLSLRERGGHLLHTFSFLGIFPLSGSRHATNYLR